MGVKEELEELKRKEEAKRLQAKEQAIRAAEARIAIEKAREEKTAAQLAELQKRWAEADKSVATKKAELYARTHDVVADWSTRRNAAKERNISSDIAHEKKMAESWQTKEARFREWQVQTEAERQERERRLAAQRSAARGRFSGELDARNDRLEQAQMRAEERRLEMQRQKQIQLAERAEAAERKAEEVWQARVRVENSLTQRTAQYDAECKRKAKQAEDCLNKRMAEIERARQANSVWRIPGSLHSSSTTLSM